MRVLVTGARGFVGRNLCCALKNVRDGKGTAVEILGQKRTGRIIWMYSAGQRAKTIETFAGLGVSTADTIAELSYPSRVTLHNFAVLRQALLGNRHILTMVVRMVRNESNRGEWSRLSFAMPAWTEGVVGNYLRDTSLRQFVSQGATSAVPCDLPLIHHLFQYAAGRGLADPEQRLRFPSGD